MHAKRGFTLAEMLVVVAVLAILGTVTLVALNPAQLLAQQRDSNRLSDLSSLSIALQDYESVAGGSLGSANTLYVSIPDPTATSTAGDQCQGLGLPALTGYTYHCAASSTYRAIDGTGWIPVNFRAIGSVLPISSLPLDPTNTTSSHLYYIFATNGTKFEVTAPMESAKYKLGGASDAISTDGGNLASVYEKGTQFGLEPMDYGDTSLVGYWPLNEGTGTIAIDGSGSNATGSWAGTQAGTSGYYSAGKVGTYAGYFNGSNDVISIPYSSVLKLGTGNFSVSAWVKTSANLGEDVIVSGNRCGIGESWILETYTNKATFATFGTGSAGYLSSPGTINDGSWHYLVGVRNGTKVFIYLDGTLANSTTVSGNYNSNSGAASIAIGNLAAGGGCNHYWNGSANDVRIYNRALSAGEIQALYSGTK